IFQLHNDTKVSPEVALDCQNDSFSISYRYSDLDPHAVADTVNPGIRTRTPWAGKLPKGRWLDWVWHVKFSPLTSEGLLEVWPNQGSGYKKIVNVHSERMGYPCSQVTNLDVGIYKWPWKCPGTDTVKIRGAYFDNVSVGDSSASFQDITGVPDSSRNFTPGNIVVLRIGDGVNPLSSTATNAVFLDEYTPSGSSVNTVALPVTVSGPNNMLSLVNTKVEGMLTRSPDSTLLALTGYATAPGTSNPTTVPGSTIPRTIGLVDYTGMVNTRLSVSDYNNSPRSVVTNGAGAWLYGGSGGVRYTPLSTATADTLEPPVSSTQVMSTPDGRAINIYNGNIYVSPSGSTYTRVVQVGTGLPVTSGHTAASLPGVAIGSAGDPYQFFFADMDTVTPGVDVLYYADFGNTDTTGIRKYSLVSGVWHFNGNVKLTSAGALGLTGQQIGNTVALYVTSTSRIFKYTDSSGYNGSISGGPLPALATVGANRQFRGIAMAPVAPSFPPMGLDKQGLPMVLASAVPSIQNPGLSIYPNPARQSIIVRHEQTGSHSLLRVVDMNGKVVYQSRVSPGEVQTTVNIFALSAGFYMLVLQDGKKKWSAPFIRE
ncbi:MAG TPA: heparin lyase I family protein, partial [Puia sp.]